MAMAAKLAGASPSKDPAFYKQIEMALRKSGLSVAHIQNRIRPVASALGLYKVETGGDYYQILGVNKNATAKEIQSAYREKAYQIHPDTRSNHQIDENAFIVLNMAYETLHDPTLRRKYDQKVRASDPANGIWNEVYHLKPRRSNENTQKRYGKYYLSLGLISILLCGGILLSDVIVKRKAIQDLDDLYQGEIRDTGEPINNAETTISLAPKSEYPSTQIQDKSHVDQRSDQGIDQNQMERNDATQLSEQIDVPNQVDGNMDQIETAPDLTPGEKQIQQEISEPQQRANNPVEMVEKEQESKERQVKDHSPEKKKNSALLRKSSTSTKKTITKSLSEEFNAPVEPHQKPSNGTVPKASSDPFMGKGGNNKKIDPSTKSLAAVVPIDERTQIQIRSEIKSLDLIRNPPTREALQTFLNRYTAAYQARRENRFVVFFSPDATENNKPLNQVLPLYREIFQNVENIDYHIRLIEYLVDLNDGLIKIKGEYRLDWDSKLDGKKYSTNGRLAMDLLSRNEGGYKIKSLTY